MDRSVRRLGPLHADLVALQECRRPDGESKSIIWRGIDPNQGVAVVSKQASLQLAPVKIPCLHPTVVPVVVHARQPFLFVGVWTHPPYDKVAWEAMSSCAREADKLKLSMVAAGDFNISPRVKGTRKTALKFLERMRDELGLVSAYRHRSDKSPGEETCATYYHQWDESKPFHIDYCFVPKSWCDRLIGVTVEPFKAFRQSDHRPLTVEIEDAIFG